MNYSVTYYFAITMQPSPSQDQVPGYQQNRQHAGQGPLLRPVGSPSSPYNQHRHHQPMNSDYPSSTYPNRYQMTNPNVTNPHYQQTPAYPYQGTSPTHQPYMNVGAYPPSRSPPHHSPPPGLSGYPSLQTFPSLNYPPPPPTPTYGYPPQREYPASLPMYPQYAPAPYPQPQYPPSSPEMIDGQGSWWYPPLPPPPPAAVPQQRVEDMPGYRGDHPGPLPTLPPASVYYAAATSSPPKSSPVETPSKPVSGEESYQRGKKPTIRRSYHPNPPAHRSEWVMWVGRLMLYNPKDQLLWRELYLNLPLDDPRKCISSQGVRRKDSDIDWRFTVQRFVHARTILYNPELAKPGETLNTLRTLLELVTWVPPMEYQYDSDHLSQNLVWVCASLQGRPFLDDIQTDNDASEEEKQLSARLHTYFGLTGMDMTKEGRVRSRAYVYDMRNYTPQNEYGPLNAGSVNWEHIRAIHHVVSMHIIDLQQEENFKLHIFPMSLPATQIVLPTPDADGPAEEVEEQDWIGLSGSWKVSFCFCDHRELLRTCLSLYHETDVMLTSISGYNEAVPDAAGNLDTSIFDEPGFGEVFRTLSVTLKTSSCRPDPKHPDRPIINFIGEMPDTTSTMSGTIQMTEDDQVQWKFVRTFGTISGEQAQAVW
ncbi:hypothetical protein H0H93_013375 [Arthromyces matolae]|nr:hypothetical protein H0H93_013375 [Arthromyces matolae]